MAAAPAPAPPPSEALYITGMPNWSPRGLKSASDLCYRCDSERDSESSIPLRNCLSAESTRLDRIPGNAYRALAFWTLNKQQRLRQIA